MLNGTTPSFNKGCLALIIFNKLVWPEVDSSQSSIVSTMIPEIFSLYKALD